MAEQNNMQSGSAVKVNPSAKQAFAQILKAKRPVSVLKLPKHFQCEKELLHRRNIVMLPDTEAEEGQGFINNLVLGKLKVPLIRLRQQIEQGEINEEALDSHLRYFLRKNDVELYRQHLLSIAYMCLKQARLATHKNDQLPLLFKSIDLLRMYIQYSDESIDVMASSIIVHIFSTFPDEFTEKLQIERDVFKHYVELHKTKRRVKDIGFGDKENVALRIKIARLSAQQKNYYDAFVQFSTILDFYRFRSSDDPQVVLNQAKAHAWIGSVFQEIIHYVQPGEATILRNFIYRYNRDHATRKKAYPIALLKRNDAIAMKKTKKDIIRLANDQYKAIEQLGTTIGEVGYKITDGAIAGLTQENYKPHLLKALKSMKGQLCNSKEELFKVFSDKSDPKPNDAQLEKLWVYVSSEAENVHQGAMLQLKRNNKWIDVYFQSMTQLAKNYVFLDMGDQALHYAKFAFGIMDPITDRRYFDQKRNAVNYLRDICGMSNLTFRNIPKRELQSIAAKYRDQAHKLNETLEKEARDRHLAAAKVLAR
ncbi:MAG: hypothetical protein HQM13_17365 [SAR324 cluster bacterium]|nr:hypothetical protein [SAR324 cluster bacterium]